MKKTNLIALGALIGTCSFAAAQDADTPKKGNRPQREVPAEILAKFDTDKDGKLSADERKAMMEARQAEILKQYDKDGDGKLSDDEKATMKADRRPNTPPCSRNTTPTRTASSARAKSKRPATPARKSQCSAVPAVQAVQAASGDPVVPMAKADRGLHLRHRLQLLLLPHRQLNNPERSIH